MAVFAGSDLKKWRESQGISAADLAEQISCDTTTIYRYESGKLKPDPDTMYEICERLGDVDRWTTWMRTEYPRSYARIHPETSPYDLKGAILSLYAEMEDLNDIRREVMRDCADGCMDDAELAERAYRELNEMLQSAQRVKSLFEATGQKRQKGVGMSAGT